MVQANTDHQKDVKDLGKIAAILLAPDAPADDAMDYIRSSSIGAQRFCRNAVDLTAGKLLQVNSTERRSACL